MKFKTRKFKEKRKESFIRKIEPLKTLITINESDYILGKIGATQHDEALKTYSTIIDEWEKAWL